MQKIAAFFLVKTGIFFFLFLFLQFHTVHASVDTIKVVATISPLADFARQVGGEKVEVTLLLPSGASPHTFEPTPKIVRKIAEASIFLKIGSGLEFWADRMIHSASTNIYIVDSSAGVDLITDIAHHDKHEHHGPEDRAHADPHIWLDPVICIQIISKIETALSTIDPPNALYYKRNAAAYQKKLRQLDKEIAERTKLFRTREYVTFHSAWNYFSRRYGLKVAAVIEESPGKEPAPRQVKKIIEILKRQNTRVVFAEPQFSPKIAETIARKRRKVSSSILKAGKGRIPIALMHFNLAIMEKA
jgi:zinc transport system substrate-binding protein